MRIKKYILAVLLVVLIGVGAFIHLASNLVGGGGLNIQLPEEIVSGETTNFLVVASVWGGGGSIEGRYTDLSLGYRLNSDGEYSVLFPELAELPDNYKDTLEYNILYCGVIRGALEMLNYKVECTFVKSPLRGDETHEIKVDLKQVLQDGAGDDYKEE